MNREQPTRREQLGQIYYMTTNQQTARHARAIQRMQDMLDGLDPAAGITANILLAVSGLPRNTASRSFVLEWIENHPALQPAPEDHKTLRFIGDRLVFSPIEKKAEFVADMLHTLIAIARSNDPAPVHDFCAKWDQLAALIEGNPKE